MSAASNPNGPATNDFGQRLPYIKPELITISPSGADGKASDVLEINTVGAGPGS